MWDGVAAMANEQRAGAHTALSGCPNESPGFSQPLIFGLVVRNPFSELL